MLDIEILEEEVFDKCRGRPRVRRGDVGKGLPRIRVAGSGVHGGELSHRLGWVNLPPTASLTQRIPSCASEYAVASKSESRSTSGGSIAITPSHQVGQPRRDPEGDQTAQ